MSPGGKEAISLEFGDVLFTLVNVARFAGFHSEPALSGAIRKFERRYRHMEQSILKTGKTLQAMPREEIDRLWEDAKEMSP